MFSVCIRSLTGCKWSIFFSKQQVFLSLKKVQRKDCLDLHHHINCSLNMISANCRSGWYNFIKFAFNTFIGWYHDVTYKKNDNLIDMIFPDDFGRWKTNCKTMPYILLMHILRTMYGEVLIQNHFSMNFWRNSILVKLIFFYESLFGHGTRIHSKNMKGTKQNTWYWNVKILINVAEYRLLSNIFILFKFAQVPIDNIFFSHCKKTYLVFLFCIDKTPIQFLYHIYGTRFINFIELLGNYIQRIDTFVGMSKHTQSSRYFFPVIIGHCMR